MRTVPTKGYILPKGYGYNYRSTALAYMKREGVNFVNNIDGETYSLKEIENAIINNTI